MPNGLLKGVNDDDNDADEKDVRLGGCRLNANLVVDEEETSDIALGFL